MSLQEQIAQLGDDQAIKILQRFARANAQGRLPDLAGAGFADRLKEAVELAPLPPTSIATTDAELARAALQLIACDAEYREGIAALLDNQATEKFVVESMLLGTAALIVLQTHVRFERDKDGKWSVKVEKKPTDTKLLKELVQKLISFTSN